MFIGDSDTSGETKDAQFIAAEIKRNIESLGKENLHLRKCSTIELLKPGETRFASFFIMFDRLLETKDVLQETIMDREYKQWMADIKKKQPSVVEKGGTGPINL